MLARFAIVPCVGAWLLCFSVGFLQIQAEPPSLPAQAMRVLQANCLSCHNNEKKKGGLLLQSEEGLKQGGDSGPVLVAGKPEESLLFTVLDAAADPHMPPKKQLSTNQVEVLRAWIAAGAAWDAEAMARASTPREVILTNTPSWYRAVLALALSADGKQLAAARGNRLFLYDVAQTNFPLMAETVAHPDAVRSLAWSPDGKTIASAAFGEMTTWQPGTNLVRNWSLTNDLNGRVGQLRYSAYGGALVAVDGILGQSASIRVLSAENGNQLQFWPAHADAVYGLALSPDGGLIATTGGDKMVKLWEVLSQKEAGQFEGHGATVMGAAFNTNGTELVTVGLDGQLRLWDVKSAQSVVTILGKNHGFTAVTWSTDGNTVIAVDDAGGVLRFRNFKRHTGEQSSSTAEERQLARVNEPLHCVAVNHDASRIFAGGDDGVVYVFDGEGKLLTKLELETKPAEPADPALEAKAQAAALPPSFVYDVLPLLSKAGCMAGACHAKPEGQNGFQLSVFNYDPKTDYHEIVKEARGRRVFPAAPSESLLLLKPTMAVEHGGGLRFEPNSETYQTIVRWIEGGLVFTNINEPTLTRVELEPAEGRLQKGASQQLKVYAHYSDGSKREVTQLADYASSDKEFATPSETGLVQVGSLSGEGVIVARFLGSVAAFKITVPADQALPPERYADLPVNNFIDRYAYTHFQKLGLYPSERSSDAEFLRRASLDTIGALPTSTETREFLNNTDPGKRRRLVEKLLQHPAWADYWAGQWADLLRPNPDRVGTKSVFMLDQWLRESFRANKRYDQFVRDILLAEGSNHRDGPVVVYRDRREAPELTTMFSQLFLGVRMECAKCHHHPNEKWSQEDFYQFAAFFGPVKQKGAGLSPPISAGTETFFFPQAGKYKHPKSGEMLSPRPPDGPVMEVKENIDPRSQLIEWLSSPDNPFFARAAVNRVWAAFFGRGFVEPVDDFRVSNPVANEALLDALAKDFVAHGYDLKHLMRTILNSHLYQLSSTPNETNLTDTKNFSRSLRRRLPAEVLLDAVCDVTGVAEEFNGCPPGTRATQTWSYKVRSQFLDAFSRPNPSTDPPCERDTGTSLVQSLHLMNSQKLHEKLQHSSGRVKKLAESSLSPTEVVTELYLSTFSRFPTAEELAVATSAYSAPGVTRQTATEDVLWALLNSAEFVFNH